MAISKVIYKSSPNASPETWMDATPATAVAADIIAPKTAMLADGLLTVGTGSGGGGLKLLKETSLGQMSTTSTSATNANKSMTVTGYEDYDLLVVDVSVDTTVNGRHTSTVSLVFVTGQTSLDTKDTYTVVGNKWCSKLSATGVASTRQNGTAYGIYVQSASVSDSIMTLAFYYRYNSNNSGTINGVYTARVYGVKLHDLIGG